MKQIKQEYQEKSGNVLAQICAQTALDTKAEELIILDVRKLTTFTEYFVIMSGRSTRHVQGLAEAIEGKLRSKRVKASTAEGLQDGMWVLLDFDDVVVHIFYHEQRKFYDLEGLWHEAKRVKVEIEQKQTS
ncbi:MAG: ribosome silencing factor [Deltaproteobacteria bacterium]|nr:ribosome silencing factor [Deltaproteobacteria bacterium]MBW2658089.1 ribosome silencing factor [Deltaproteobacteria bacterium]